MPIATTTTTTAAAVATINVVDPQSVPGFLPEGEALDSDEEESETRPEDAIPDLPENQKARDFLRRAPRHGLHMPLGQEVKVMQCWRCKAYGHRSGDKECPLRDANQVLDGQRRQREDPMSAFVSQAERDRQEKYERVEQLRVLVEEIRAEERERKRRKQERKEKKKLLRKEEKERRERSSGKNKKDKKDKH